ncbi:MAG: peptidoglycan-binding protein [Actinomycetota bacterium]
MPVVIPSRHRGPATAVRAAMAVVVVLLVASVGLPASTAQADQDIVFDGAGDARQLSLIGDSTLAGVRWYDDYGDLRRYNFVLNAESCRRTVEQSCISREGYRSANVVSTMRSLDGALGELLVVMTGYNDPVWSIDESIVEVTAEARRQGVEHVLWLTLRTSFDVDYSDPQEQSSIDTFREYNDRLLDAAEASGGFLQLADWGAYSFGATEWFEYDGVHLTPSGVGALTGFLAEAIDRVLAGDQNAIVSTSWTVLVPGAEGPTVSAVQEAMIEAGIDVPGGADGVYGNDTMAAVAEFQRRNGDLQVTGAVDAPTARALGVDLGTGASNADDPASTDDEPVEPPSADAPPGEVAESAVGTADAASNDIIPLPSTPATDAGSRLMSGWFLALALIVALVGAVILRRRHVVARRRSLHRP